MEEVYWTTKDGRKINYFDMDDNHILNTIKLIEKNSKRLSLELRLKELSNSMRFPEGSDALEDARGDFIESLATDSDLEIVRKYYKSLIKLREEAEKRHILDNEEDDVPDENYCNLCEECHHADELCSPSYY